MSNAMSHIMNCGKKIALMAAMLPALFQPQHAKASAPVNLPIEVVASEVASSWLVADAEAQVTHLTLIFDRAGAAFTTPEKAGLPYLASLMLGRATAEKDQATFQQALEKRGMRLSFSAGAERLLISLSTLAEHRADAFALLVEAITQPRLADDFFVQIQQEAMANLRRAQQRPAWHAQTELATQLYGNHPYALPTLGTEESLKALTAANVQTWLAQHLHPKMLHIAATGKIDAKALKDVTETLSAALIKVPEAKAEPVSALPSAPPKAAFMQHQTLEAPQVAVAFALPAVGYDHADFFPLLVANHLVGGGGFGSLLMDDIREAQGLVYGISTRLDVEPSDALIVGQAATRPESLAQLKTSLKALLAEVSTEGVSAGQLHRAKTYMTNNYILRFDSRSRLASMLAFLQVENFGKDYPALRNQKIEAVTLADVNRVLAEYFTPQQLMLVSAGIVAE